MSGWCLTLLTGTGRTRREAVLTGPLASREAALTMALKAFEHDLTVRMASDPSLREDLTHQLGGRSLTCWCPLLTPGGDVWPCHGEVLLRLANPTDREHPTGPASPDPTTSPYMTLGTGWSELWTSTPS